MKVMESRHAHLQHTLDVLKETNVSLVAFTDQSYYPGGSADDLGIYYFIPWISKILGLSIDQGINLFFGSLLLFGAAISVYCFFFIFKDWIARFISVAGLGLLTFGVYSFSDVYMASFFAVVSTVPLFLIWNRKRCEMNWKFFLTLAFCGVLLGYCNMIRTHAGTGVLLFISAWVLLNQTLSKSGKFASLTMLIIFFSLPYVHFKILESNRDQFLSQMNPSFHPAANAHPKWHAIYIGFGYLENKYGIKYSDTVSYEKVMSINSNAGYCTDEYERILMNECFLLAKNDPIFVMKTIFSKILVILLELIKFANIGLLFAILYVKPSLKQVLPFFICASFYSLPGILTIPLRCYLVGLVSIATLFGIYMICLGIEKYQKSRSASSMERAESLI